MKHRIHHLCLIHDIIKPVLHKFQIFFWFYINPRILRLYFCLHGIPQHSPCNIIRLPRCPHASFCHFLQRCSLISQHVLHGLANAGLKVSPWLPLGNCTILLGFLNRWFHRCCFHKVLWIHHRHGAHERCWLLNYHSKIRTYGCCLITACEAVWDFWSISLGHFTIDIFHKVDKVALCSSAKCSFHLLSYRLHGDSGVCPVLMVIPYHCIRQRHCERIIIGHIAYMICKHIKNVTNYDWIACVFHQALCHALIADCIQRRLISLLIHILCFSEVIIRLDRPIRLFAKFLIAIHFHRYFISPFRTFLCKKLLHLPRYLLLLRC